MPIVEIATHENSVREIVLNAPEHRNALSLAMLGELNEALSGEIGQTRAVVINGAGKTFCAGGHLEELGGGEAADLALDEAISDVCNCIRVFIREYEIQILIFSFIPFVICYNM